MFSFKVILPALLACICGAWFYWAFYTGSLSNVEALYASLVFSGRLAACLILLTFITSPLKVNNLSLSSWLLENRRYIGINGGLLLYMHLIILYFYLQVATPQTLLYFIIFGVPTMVVLTAMLLTSNNYSQRRLGVYWKKLHTTGQWMICLTLFVIFLMRFIREKDVTSFILMMLIFSTGLWRLTVDVQNLVTRLRKHESNYRPRRVTAPRPKN